MSSHRRTSLVRALAAFALLWGVALIGIGLAHLALGNASFLDGGTVTPSIDSEERFFAALTMGYGGAYVWAAFQRTVPRHLLIALAATTALGATGRAFSWIDRGAPHWFFMVFGVGGEYLAALLTYRFAMIGPPRPTPTRRRPDG